MKLTFKTIAKKETFTLADVDPGKTVLEVKNLINEAQGFDVALQKLIYSGKILADEKTIESYSIKEKDFIVCMVSKAKAPPKASVPATPLPATAAETPAAPPVTPAPVPVTTPSAPTQTSQESRSSGDPNAFAAGEARTQAVTMLMEMGHDRADVERAMRAAFNNPDRAVEYLLDGIPEHLLREQAPSQAPTTPSPVLPSSNPDTSATSAAAAPQQPAARSGNLFEAAAQQASGAPGAGSPAGGQSLEFLRNDPQFAQLRQLVQSNPQMLEPILQQLAASNPQLAGMITQNPEQFLQLLAGDDGEDGALPPGAQQIQVTPEENAAIERLVGLGFSQQMVLQAYFACDKNEEVAANYLFEHGHDDDDYAD